MKKSKRLDRREFLALIGTSGTFGVSLPLLFSPSHLLAKSIVAEQIDQAKSKYLKNSISAQPARNLVQIHPYGGPTRWFFDHVLRPTDNDLFVPSAGVYNRIKSINQRQPHQSEGYYSDAKVNGFNMPFLWQFDVPAAGGGMRPMSDLLKNMLTIRGCNAAIDAHPVGSARQVTPTVGSVSINGLVADRSSTLIPAVGVGRTPANRAFRSNSGVGMVDIPPDTQDYISFLLEAFCDETGNQKSEAEDFEKVIEIASRALEAYSQTNHPGAEVLYADRKNAIKLIRKGIANLKDVFPQIEARYQDLLDRGLHGMKIPGVNDKVIPGISFPCEVPGDASVLAGLASHHKSQHVLCFDDLRHFFVGAKTQLLAKQFALAEFTLTEGLSSALMLSSPNERGFTLVNLKTAKVYPVSQIEKTYDQQKKTTQFRLKQGSQLMDLQLDIDHDSHETGWLTNIVSCGMYFPALSSCMLELIDQLKAVRVGSGNLFDETVLQLATEFDRYPTENGSGLSHHPQAYVTSFYSGAIDRQILLGNIFAGTQPNPSLAGEPNGTNGAAAPVKGLENVTINMNNISSTLSELLRVPRIVPRAQSLIKVNQSRIEPTIELARNIVDEKNV